MIPLLPLRLTYQPEGDLNLGAFAGAFWRGQIGAALRSTSCITGAETCKGCPAKQGCLYGYSFETPDALVSSGPLAGYPDVPHPYVIAPAHAAGKVLAGSRVNVDLSLFGRAAADWLNWRTAIATLRAPDGSPVRLIETQVRDLTSLEPGHHRAVDELRPRPPQTPNAHTTFRLELATPMRLRRKGCYLGPSELDFPALFGSLSRRLSMLHQVVTGAQLDLDFAALTESARDVHWEPEALRWFDWHRVSGRQRRRIPMGGVVGSVRVSNVSETLWPLVWTGQWLHTGKGAVMGLGRYRVVV